MIEREIKMSYELHLMKSFTLLSEFVKYISEIETLGPFTLQLR